MEILVQAAILQKGQKLAFSDAVKQRWHVHRDKCGDEYVQLKGRHAQKLKNSRGLDHIYIIGPTKLGLWITSGSPIDLTERSVNGNYG